MAPRLTWRERLVEKLTDTLLEWLVTGALLLAVLAVKGAVRLL